MLRKTDYEKVDDEGDRLEGEGGTSEGKEQFRIRELTRICHWDGGPGTLGGTNGIVHAWCVLRETGRCIMMPPIGLEP